MSPRIGSLFSGYGGLDLGVQAVIGGEVVWHCEWDDAPSKILERNFPGVPNFRDVSKVDWNQVPPVDVLTGGFPCQDVSLAGARRGLAEGTRSGLWSEFAKAIDVLRPRLVVIENVRGLLSASAHSDVESCAWCLGDESDEPSLRALGAVLGDLADLGFDAEWQGVRAADAGAPHNRFRVFIIAWPANSDGFRPIHGQSWFDSATGGVYALRDVGSGGSSEGLIQPVKYLFDTPDTMPDAPNYGSNRRDQIAGLGNQAVSLVVPEESLLRTPSVTDSTGGARSESQASSRGQMVKTADQMVQLAFENGLKVSPSVSASLLPTPNTMDHLPARTVEQKAANKGKGGYANVRETVVNELLPTITTQDAKNNGSESQQLRNTKPLNAEVVGQNWGRFAPAIHRWELVLGRPAPKPTKPDGKDGAHRLSSKFTEWMMGLPDGWITDCGLTRNEELKACGNGVVPQQAALALSNLLEVQHA